MAVLTACVSLIAPALLSAPSDARATAFTRSRTGALSHRSLRSLRCSLAAAVFVGSGETGRGARLSTSVRGSPSPPADRRHEHREPTRSSLFAQRLNGFVVLLSATVALIPPALVVGALRRSYSSNHALAHGRSV
jgi:hypothetical protein